MTQISYSIVFWTCILATILSPLFKVPVELAGAFLIVSAIYAVGSDISKRLQELKE